MSSECKDYEVEVEELEVSHIIDKIKEKFPGALYVSGSYHPETNSIVIVAVCKDNEKKPDPADTKKEGEKAEGDP